MKQGLGLKNFAAVVVGVVAIVMSAGGVARAQYLYRTDSNPAGESFNNSELTDTEDNWVANAYQVVPQGTRLLSIQYPIGTFCGCAFSNQPVTALIYIGSSLTDPCAGGGLYELQRVQTTISGGSGDTVTINLNTPIDLNVGDIFYAALLIRQIPPNIFPFDNDTIAPLGHSFFDVGYYQGGPYDLDVQHWAMTVNGGTHPVVDSGVQSPGNTFLRVNATTTP
jgi:hypothetical protein